MSPADRQQRKPPTDPGRLAGLSEIAQRLGVTRQRAQELSRTDGFPPPLDELRMGPVWDHSTIDHWAQRHRGGSS